MKTPLKIALALSASVLLSACSDEDMQYFLDSGSGDWSAGSSTQSAPSVRTYEPRRCYQTSATHQTCFN